MGYSTDFEGQIFFDKPLTIEQKNYLNTFSSIRHMRRDVSKLQQLYNGKYGFNGSYGYEGAYFAKDDGQHGQSKDNSILDFNEAPGQDRGNLNNWHETYLANKQKIENGLCVPGLWCQWRVSDNGTYLEWDGGEKFYNYTEWLKYLIEHFFKVWSVVLNGEITWAGEDSDDKGKIIVKNNAVTTKKAKITYE